MAPPAAEDSATRQSLDRYNFDRDNSPGDSKATHSEKHEAQKQEESQRQDGKRELHQGDCWDKLGFSFSTTKKWWVLIVIFAVQVSMNFNASVYGNAISGNPDKNIKGMVQDFDISEQTARVGQLVFLIAYAFGCELWAPWSEEIGRKPILQLSLFLVNIWQIPCALAPNFAIIIVCRLLGGLSSAGGSVTLGLVADMWEPDDQQYAVAFVVLSSVGGSVVGPVVGGFIQTYLSWRWVFWMQAILGGAVQLLHLVACPETTTRVLVDREAKRRRKAGEEEVYGPGELEEHRFGPRKLLTIMLRPFVMFFTEPIVLFLSLLSGFSDALIFTFLESYTPVFKQWNFSIIDTGLAFLPLLIGYLIAWPSFFPTFRSQIARRKKYGTASVAPEERLWWLLWLAPLEAIGLIGFAWTSLGPPQVPWIAPLIFSALVGIANYAIYMATIDYMIAAYGPYAASATGGNGLARDFLAGIAALYATPLYSNVGGKYHLEYATTILACLAVLVTLPIYIFYWKGPEIRNRSKFAQSVGRPRKHRRIGGRA